MIKRTIALILCLTTLFPAGASAGPGSLPHPAPAQRSEAVTFPGEPDLNLPQTSREKIVVAQNDSTAAVKEPESRDRSCGGFRNWVDIHMGGYRWIYWAVAAGALIAIHAAH